MKDLSIPIVQFLKNHPEVFAYCNSRVFSPAFPLIDGKNVLNPKISLKQIGGSSFEPKYSIYFRGDNLISARELANVVLNIFEKENVILPNIDLEWVNIESSIFDVPIESTGEGECFFYCSFQYSDF